ncbi:MAG: hypothetical protein JJU13_14205 [Balneolaceae bacterium]|nr:hypothetical protein [Balneolaceae bacterium]
MNLNKRIEKLKVENPETLDIEAETLFDRLPELISEGKTEVPEFLKPNFEGYES